jgi:hypothetical protein
LRGGHDSLPFFPVTPVRVQGCWPDADDEAIHAAALQAAVKIAIESTSRIKIYE